ncbi:GNAT family N-acetyltransferase [Bacillus tianshenii]|uniref:GNAT family N-acetyltransferase n=1 Tax=Sutcliffiella tianshenii TaxID=1463404 RepID=UPI001CD6E705|nr:GNAT family N-acetyltransferase [Bacillus tianshenii]MCA1320317.1 GNAT family N-acetyltransferase [Bacillus tianshenii]
MEQIKTLEVQRAVAEDGPAILKILKDRAALLKEKGSTQWNFLLTNEEDEEIKEYVVKGFFFKVMDGQDIVATFLLSPTQNEWDIHLWGQEESKPSTVYLHKLAVAPDRRGGKIGDFVMKWIKEYAARQRIETVRLDCVASDFLRNFYESHGYILYKDTQGQLLYEWKRNHHPHA